ncbi:MAG: hypothetical protein P9L92_15185 [Candidatus Electryonea clarkiae]|nr:hypothetical protein [Candidatus Electryonea clarkiae]MDP8287524.1 hypothetical protein [Candidatus Electryonea clarkiae]
MKPVNNNNALIPRHPNKSREYPESTIEDSEVKQFTSYAPPGASFRARVRRLGEHEVVEEIEQVGTTEISSPIPSISNRSFDSTEDEELIIKVEAEVSFKGDFPKEGVTIETSTQIRTNSGKINYEDEV